jgi:glycosyltransferase involved in cell wall biosynthesis
MENMTYKISIIIPVFNVEHYIKESLNSIIKQSIGFENLEVIMVNDGSTDKSGEIIDQFASKYDNFKAIHLPENSGTAGKPRNIGIKFASSKYLMFLDPDDYYTDDACELLYNKIIEEKADIISGKYDILKSDQIIEINFKNKGFENSDIINVKNIDECENLLKLPPSVWTKIFKHEFIQKNKIMFPEGIPGEDLVFFIESMLRARKIVFLNDYVVYHYRIRDKNNKSVSFNYTKKLIMGLIEAYICVLELLIKHGKEKYFPNTIKDHLGYWIEKISLSDLSYKDKMEALEKSEKLFENCKKGNVVPNLKITIPVFDFIINKQFEEAILSMEKVRSVSDINQIKKQYENKLQKQKQQYENKLQKQKQQYENKLQKQKQLIHEIKTSNSWKITKPLRKASNYIKPKN